MLVSDGMKKVFWIDFISTIMYLINRRPSTTLRMKRLGNRFTVPSVMDLGVGLFALLDFEILRSGEQ